MRKLREFRNIIKHFFLANDIKWFILHPLKFLYQTRFCSRIRVWWNFIWIRKDEFLKMDGVAMLKMNEKEREKYLEKLNLYRQITHDPN